MYAHTTTGSDALTDQRVDRLFARIAKGAPAIRRPRVAKHEPRLTDGHRAPVTTWLRMSDTQVLDYVEGRFTPTDAKPVQGGFVYVP